jgi:predicted nucleic acid-binding protein
VVDSSVGVKWVIKEDNSPEALALLSAGHHLLVPELFYSEVMNVLWKRTRRKEPEYQITEKQAREGLAAIQAVDLEVTSSEELRIDALEIALEIGHATYDCEYLALAFANGIQVVTADKALYGKLSAHPYHSVLRWVDPTNTP